MRNVERHKPKEEKKKTKQIKGSSELAKSQMLKGKQNQFALTANLFGSRNAAKHSQFVKTITKAQFPKKMQQILAKNNRSQVEVGDIKQRMGEGQRSLKVATMATEQQQYSHSQNIFCHDLDIVRSRKKFLDSLHQGQRKLIKKTEGEAEEAEEQDIQNENKESIEGSPKIEKHEKKQSAKKIEKRKNKMLVH